MFSCWTTSLTLEWTGFSQRVRGRRLHQGAESAVAHGYDVRVLVWWLRRYWPEQETLSMAHVLQFAIKRSQLPDLE